MDQSVDGGDGHGFVREALIPAAEGLVGGDGDAAVLVAPGDQLEEDAGLGLVLVGIGDVIEVEADQRAFRGKDRPPTSAQTDPVWPGRPRGRDRGGRPGAFAPDRWFECKRRGARLRPEHGQWRTGRGSCRSRNCRNLTNGGNEIAAAIQPVARSEGFHPRVWQGWQCLEVEGGQGLARRKLRLGQMAADTAHVTLGQLIFRQNGEASSPVAARDHSIRWIE